MCVQRQQKEGTAGQDEQSVMLSLVLGAHGRHSTTSIHGAPNLHAPLDLVSQGSGHPPVRQEVINCTPLGRHPARMRMCDMLAVSGAAVQIPQLIAGWPGKPSR